MTVTTGLGRLWTATRGAVEWHVTSQHRSRRNALVASTALTQRRREYLEVEDFLARHRRRHDARTVATVRRTG